MAELRNVAEVKVVWRTVSEVKAEERERVLSLLREVVQTADVSQYDGRATRALLREAICELDEDGT